MKVLEIFRISWVCYWISLCKIKRKTELRWFLWFTFWLMARSMVRSMVTMIYIWTKLKTFRMKVGSHPGYLLVRSLATFVLQFDKSKDIPKCTMVRTIITIIWYHFDSENTHMQVCIVNCNIYFRKSKWKNQCWKNTIVSDPGKVYLRAGGVVVSASDYK